LNGAAVSFFSRFIRPEQVFFQPDSVFTARVTVTANGLQSAHACLMKWKLCDATLDAMIGPCPTHGGVGMIDGIATDQVCGAFVVAEPLSIEPATGFDFAFGSAEQGKRHNEQNFVRIEVDVSRLSTVVYEGAANAVEHSTTGASLDKILCDRGLCLRSSSSKR
jgi:hypothetical protein